MKILNTIYNTLFGYEPYKPLRYFLMALLSLLVIFMLFAFDMFVELPNDPINIKDIIFNISVGVFCFSWMLLIDMAMDEPFYKPTF